MNAPLPSLTEASAAIAALGAHIGPALPRCDLPHSVVAAAHSRSPRQASPGSCGPDQSSAAAALMHTAVPWTTTWPNWPSSKTFVLTPEPVTAPGCEGACPKALPPRVAFNGVEGFSHRPPAKPSGPTGAPPDSPVLRKGGMPRIVLSVSRIP